MASLLITLLAAVAALALLMAGLGIKMLCGRSREFKRPCESHDATQHKCQRGDGHCYHCTCRA